MSEAARRPATYQDVLNAPENMIAEILDGGLHTQPRPGAYHSLTTTILGAELGPLFLRRGGGGSSRKWHIVFEPELHLNQHIVVPDLAGWRTERMPRIPKQAYFTLPPDWVCEVLSPRTALLDRTTKKRIYAQQRIECLWLVDPVDRTLEVYKRTGDFWQELSVHGGGEVVRVFPFEELELNLGGWWAEGDEDSPDAEEGS